MSQSLELWTDEKELAEIKRQYASTLNETEFSLYCKIGMATGLNPFLREIWCTKYGNQTSIFIGRDGYRKSAQAHKDYAGHTVDAVYAEDAFKANPCEGTVEHAYGKDRKTIIGAYCIVHRKFCRPMYNYVEFKEYNTNQSVWKTKPATMIKKVAEAQGLRGAFQELFAGTYEESEQWQEYKNVVNTSVSKKPKNSDIYTVEQKTAEDKNSLIKSGGAGGAVIATIKNSPSPITREKFLVCWFDYVTLAYPHATTKEIEELLREKLKKAFGVETTKELTDNQLDKFADRIKLEIQRIETTQETNLQDVIQTTAIFS